MKDYTLIQKIFLKLVLRSQISLGAFWTFWPFNEGHNGLLRPQIIKKKKRRGFNEKSLDFSMYGQPLFPTSSIFVGQPLQPKPPSHHCPWPNSFLVSLSLPRALSFHLCLSPSISLSLHDISTVHS